MDARLQQEFGLKDAVVIPSGGLVDTAFLTQGEAFDPG
jgi:DNA-binding transcriptional regulator LsrR (DeoR family)